MQKLVVVRAEVQGRRHPGLQCPPQKGVWGVASVFLYLFPGMSITEYDW